MIPSFIGGVLIGRVGYVLFSNSPPYPKPIVAMLVLAGLGLFIFGLASPSLLF